MTEAKAAGPAPDPAAGRVTLEADGAVALIGLDRPAKLNGFSRAMLTGLARAYTEFERDARYRVAVVYGVGANFTAGLELDKVVGAMDGEGFWPADCVDPLDRRPPLRTKPVVTAVQGYCFTIGIELMLAGDIGIAAESTVFSQLEVGRGVMATGGATIRMVARAGWGNAMAHLLTGDRFGAMEALRCGFVQEIVPDGEQFERALELARLIADQAPLAVRATLANARKALHQGPDAAMAEFREVQARLLASEDAKEGIASFTERRQARFQGR